MQQRNRARLLCVPLVAASTFAGAVGLRSTQLAFDQPTPTYQATTRLLVTSADGRVGNVKPAQLPDLVTGGDVPATVASRVHWSGSVESLIASVQASLADRGNQLVISTTQVSAVGAELVANAFADELQASLAQRRRDGVARRLGASELELANLEAEVAELQAQVLGNPGDRVIEARHDAAVRSYRAAVEDRRRLDDVLTEDPELTTLDRAHATALPIDLRSVERKRTALGGVLGAIVGTEIAIVAVHLAGRRRSRENAQRVTGLRVLAELPAFPSPPRRAGRSGAARRGGHRLVDPGAKGRAPESLRLLRHQLSVLLDDQQRGARPADVVVVCSADDGDGKSTLVANLAASFAHPDLRVIVVNADPQHTTVSSFFDVHPGAGAQAPRPTSRPGLRILDLMPDRKASGPVHERDHRFARALARRVQALRDDAELILVDTASLGTSTAALELIRSSSAVLLVVRAGRTRPEHGARAAGLLRFAGARSLSLVVTGSSRRHKGDTAATLDDVGLVIDLTESAAAPVGAGAGAVSAATSRTTAT